MDDFTNSIQGRKLNVWKSGRNCVIIKPVIIPKTNGESIAHCPLVTLLQKRRKGSQSSPNARASYRITLGPNKGDFEIPLPETIQPKWSLL